MSYQVAEPTASLSFPVEHPVELHDAMQRHRTYFIRMAYSILHHTEDAEDAVQAAFLSAWAAWASFRGQSSLKTWLTTIVMNKALSELRSQQRRSWLWIDGDPVSMAETEMHLSMHQITPEQQAIREEAVQRVRDRLENLPHQTRCIVLLRYADDLSVEEIAQSNGTTRGAVKGHIRRGCQALRKGVRVIPKQNLGKMFAPMAVSA